MIAVVRAYALWQFYSLRAIHNPHGAVRSAGIS